MYLSAHAGDNYVSHGHNDGGTFVFQALGKEWFCDLGAENYAVGTGVTNMDTYRVRTEGHNLYIINPRPDSMSQKPGVQNNNRMYAGQAHNGRAEIIDFQSDDLTVAFHYADYSFISPLIYDENYIPFLIDYCRKNKIDIVVSRFDIDLPVLTKNKDKFIEIGTKVIVSD